MLMADEMQGEKPQGLNKASPPSFWFERLFRAVKVPFWLGAIILAFIGPLIQLFDSEISRTDFLIELSFFYFAVTVYMQFAAVYVGRQSEKAMDLAEAMGSGPMDRMRRKLYSTEWGLVVFVIIDSLFFRSYFSSLEHFELMDIFRDNQIPYTFIVLIFSNTVWAFFYSMKSLYTVGTQDPHAEVLRRGQNARVEAIRQCSPSTGRRLRNRHPHCSHPPIHRRKFHSRKFFTHGHTLAHLFSTPWIRLLHSPLD